MSYVRTTITINRIPIHSEYSSTRLTVFTFGKNKQISDLSKLLVWFTEEQLGYEMSDWWFEATLNIAEQEVNSKEAKGLGFYRIEVAWDDDKGSPTVTEKYDAHPSKFGEFIE